MRTVAGKHRTYVCHALSYGGHIYDFDLYGDMYDSALGGVGDKVARLIDASDNFDVLYFGVRHSLPIVAAMTNNGLQGKNIALYLQRKNTREVIFIEVEITSELTSIINAMLNTNTSTAAPYETDMWSSKLFAPVDSGSTLQSTGTQGTTYNYEVTTLAGNGLCTLDETISYVIILEGDGDIRYDEAHTFTSGIGISSKSTTAKVTPNLPYPVDPVMCSEYYDRPNSSSLRIGTRTGTSLTVEASTHGQGVKSNPSSYKADYFVSARFNGESEADTNGNITIGYAVGVPYLPGLSVELASAEIGYEALNPEPSEIVFKHLVNGKQDLNQYRTRWDKHIFKNMVLSNADHSANAFWEVKHWQGGRFDSDLYVKWTVPVSSDHIDAITKSRRIDLVTHTFLLPFKSGQ
jgi:hypothetical protein